jgi:ferritin-like metal-binding protein YciE
MNTDGYGDMIMAMKMDTLRKLFIHTLKDSYNAENQLIEALPKMAEAATAPQLAEGFRAHLKQTQEHVRRIERIFDAMGGSPSGVHCKGMEGLIKEGQEAMEEEGEPDVLDAGLIAAAQKVEHYEIAAYGTACAYAKLLGEDEALRLLHQTLEEEKMTDELLTQMAESQINPEAMNQGGQSGQGGRSSQGQMSGQSQSGRRSQSQR